MNRFSNLRILAGILLLLLLAVSATSTVMAQGGSECDQSSYCTLIENESDEGEYTANGSITKLVIKSGSGGEGGDEDKFFTFEVDPTGYDEQVYDDGCYLVAFLSSEIEGETFQYPFNKVVWIRYGEDSPECQAISHVQVWQSTPTNVGLVDFLVEVGTNSPPRALWLLFLLLIALTGLLWRRWWKSRLQQGLQPNGQPA